MSKRLLIVALLVGAGALTAATGCGTAMSPIDWGVGNVPIPVSPYFQKRLEDKSWDQERYAKMPILGPLGEGIPDAALDPPSDDEVMRALEKARPIQGGLPFLSEAERDNVRIVVEPIADFVDPPRVYPLIGPAQLHHCRYKCTIYFSEIKRTGWPIPYTEKNEDAREVIYIDHSHLHMVGNPDAGTNTGY
ncbi:MAG: hypothetical protein D6741_10520 [Planctomycetota bacterium]|nr:MAG: hypothetical protein D6741_10520 [Planctomycetota bacterium]